MHLHVVDARLLSRAGQVLACLTQWIESNPTDRHPTVDQLASVDLGDGQQLHRRTVIRGIAELTAWGLIENRPDPEHRVTRSLGLRPRPPAEPAIPVATPARLVTSDQSGAPDLSPLLRSKTDSHENVGRRDDKFVTEQKPSKEGRRDGHIGDPLSKLKARLDRLMGEAIAQGLAEPKLADLGHLEHQRRLALGSPGPAAGAAEPPTGCRLRIAVGALETGRPEAVAPAVAKLCEQFGADFEPFYRRVCTAIQTGTAHLGALVEAIEEATRPNARHPGRSFTAAAKRRFPLLYARSEPAAESPLPGPPTAGPLTDTVQSTGLVG